MQMNQTVTQGDRQPMPQLLTRVLSYLRRNVIAFLALFFAIGAGGGYAIAATSNKTIHGCVNKRTRRAECRANFDLNGGRPAARVESCCPGP